MSWSSFIVFFFFFISAGIPNGKLRLIPTRPFIRAHTVIGGKMTKATRTQDGHSTGVPLPLDQEIRTVLLLNYKKQITNDSL